MRDNIHYLLLCSQLMSGKYIGDGNADLMSVDNMFYDAFGMSSEDILENFKSSAENSELK